MHMVHQENIGMGVTWLVPVHGGVLNRWIWTGDPDRQCFAGW